MRPLAATLPATSTRGWPAWPGLATAGLWLVTIAAAVAWVVVLVASHQHPELAGPVDPTELAGPLVAAVAASLGWLVVLRGDARQYGWVMLGFGAVVAVVGAAARYSAYTLAVGPGADLPLAGVAVWVQDLWMVSWLFSMLLLPALFPDGTPASPGWGRAVKVTAAGWVGLIVVFALARRPASNVFGDLPGAPPNPTGILTVPEMAINLTWVAVSVASLVIAIGSLVSRWRHADTELRQRFKWVLYAFGVLLLVAGAGLAHQVAEAAFGLDLGLAWLLNVVFAVAGVGLIVALGVAVLKLRLYDVDLVINRTIVYGVLTVAIVVAYIAVVVGIGALLPADETFLALVATGIVAVAFAPVRDRVQRWVNRVMFGQRDDPYGVLSELGRLVGRSGAPTTTLQVLVETVATALKLPGAAIELAQDDGWRTRAAHGLPVEADGEGIVVPLHHQGEVVGRLVVAPRSPREPLAARDHRLLEDIAHQAGALAHSVRLTSALQRSRQRLVVAREEERRRIRRDLHDGLGPSLASQTFQLDAALERLAHDPAGAADLLVSLKHHNQELVGDIRRLVYELRPPALDELGIAEALVAHTSQLEHTGRLAIEVHTTPQPLPSLPAAVEVAAYRIAREAITNVVRHARATRCGVRLEATGSQLAITVIDDGIGIDLSARGGVGLISMRERAEELGGTFDVGPAAATGSRVHATLPVAIPAPVQGSGNGARPAAPGGIDAFHG